MWATKKESMEHNEAQEILMRWAEILANGEAILEKNKDTRDILSLWWEEAEKLNEETV